MSFSSPGVISWLSLAKLTRAAFTTVRSSPKVSRSSTEQGSKIDILYCIGFLVNEDLGASAFGFVGIDGIGWNHGHDRNSSVGSFSGAYVERWNVARHLGNRRALDSAFVIYTKPLRYG